MAKQTLLKGPEQNQRSHQDILSEYKKKKRSVFFFWGAGGWFLRVFFFLSWSFPTEVVNIRSKSERQCIMRDKTETRPLLKIPETILSCEATTKCSAIGWKKIQVINQISAPKGEKIGIQQTFTNCLTLENPQCQIWPL